MPIGRFMRSWKLACVGLAAALCIGAACLQAQLPEPAQIQGIVCWGDSLTFGNGGDGTTYPQVLQALLEKNGCSVPEVVNMGVGGETSTEITARAGGLEILLSEDLTIPGECEPVQVFYEAADGSRISLLRHGDGGASQVSICGIEGKLSIQRDSYLAKECTYWFTRSLAGSTITVAAGTRLINAGSYLYQDYLPIIFMGQNGGWHTPEELIAQQEAILDACGADRGQFLILGLTTADAADRRELERAMADRWGTHYLNLRKALCDTALIESLGLACTAEDLAMIDHGSVPGVLRADDVHFNAAGYTLIATLVYERLVTLGYVSPAA